MKHATLLTIVALTAHSVLAGDARVKLTTQFPPPLVIGTPVNVTVPNLEPAQKGEAPDLLVPAGTKNLAAGKPVTSSNPEPLLGTLDLITDGDKAADEGCFVELAAGKQWVQIDLGQTSGISAIWLWHFHSQKRAYQDVIVQVSDDPDFLSKVTTVFNNDHDNSSGMGVGTDFAYYETNKGRLIPVKDGVKGRYVRLYSNGNTTNKSNHYIEVEVFGKPAS